jgi:peptide/nickel transport system substrate-binding protein
MNTIARRSVPNTIGFLAPLMLIAAMIVSSCAPAPGGGGSGAGESGVSIAPKILRIGMQAQNEPTGGTDGPVSPAPYGGSGNGSPALEHYLMFHGGLTMFDPQSKVVPHLAQKLPTLEDGDWKLLPGGGMEVTWKLRPGIRWHDGTPLTAEDFVLGLQLIRDPDLPKGPRGELASIAEVTATDSNTLVATWRTQSILGNVSNNDGIPAVPRHLLTDLYQTGDKTAFENSPLWNTQWVGLGPYRMSEWSLGSHIEGRAFDQYFLGRPKIDRVVIKYIGDVNALIANVLSGDIDVIPLGGQLDIPQMVTVRQAWEPTGGGLTLPIPKGVRTIYLQFRDPTLPWVQDLRIRQALLHSLDRPEIVETLLSGQTDVARFFLAPGEPAYRLAEQRGVPRYDFDPSRAERLMGEAGWNRGADRLFHNSSGQTLPIDVTASGQGANVQEAQTVASQWTTAGFQSRPTPYPAAAENATEIRHNQKGALIWPYNFSPTVIKTFTTPEIGTAANRWRGGNYGGYVNPTYEGLYGELINTFDATARDEVTFQMLKLLADELPALPVFFTPLALVARKGVEGPGTVSAMQAANAWNIHSWELKN